MWVVSSGWCVSEADGSRFVPADVRRRGGVAVSVVLLGLTVVAACLAWMLVGLGLEALLQDRDVCCGFILAPVGLVRLPLPFGAVVSCREAAGFYLNSGQVKDRCFSCCLHNVPCKSRCQASVSGAHGETQISSTNKRIWDGLLLLLLGTHSVLTCNLNLKINIYDIRDCRPLFSEQIHEGTTFRNQKDNLLVCVACECCTL